MTSALSFVINHKHFFQFLSFGQSQSSDVNIQQQFLHKQAKIKYKAFASYALSSLAAKAKRKEFSNVTMTMF